MKQIRFLFILVGLIPITFDSLSMGTSSCKGYGLCDGKGGRVSVTRLTKNQSFDPELLNIKSYIQSSKTSVQVAISITQSEFQTLANEGNTWMSFATNNDQITMNVGVANNSNPQSWTLPTNINNYFEFYVRNDFIAPASVPNYIDLPVGTTHVMKIPYENPDDYTANNYKYYEVSPSNVVYLGEDYDFDAQSDADFDAEPDFIFAHVPLALNDSYSSSSELFDPTVNGSLYKEDYTTFVDGYGTISTPDGTFDCLRIKYVINKFSRSTIQNSFSAAGTVTRYQWVSDNGFTFEGEVVSENPTTHEATLSNLTMNKIVPTNLLTETTDVKLNNDSKGVTINTNNDFADPSAILDISSNNQGILLPRIAETNRPTNPAIGLLIYQLDNSPGFYFYDGTAWQKLNATMPIALSNNARVAHDVKSEVLSTYGKSQLKKGIVFIKFDKPQDDFENIQVNIQLETDCKGLYISKKTRDGFEVKELQRGKSNAKFSWQIN